MINIELIQKTAESLMAKAAIEIPDDYLSGLQKAANDEDGDLSSFVLGNAGKLCCRQGRSPRHVR